MIKVNWVDSLKGFAIILVVLGHISSPLSSFIYAFHMPLFFIVSGFFLNPTNELKREIIYLILKYSRFLIIEIILIAIAFLIGYNFNFPFAIDDGLISAPYIFIGYYFYKNKDVLTNKTTAVVLLIPLILISLIYGVPDLNMSTKYFESIFINLIWTCALSFLLFILFSNLKFNLKALEYLGVNSLLIFLIHPYTNNIAYYAASNYLLQLFISLSMLVLITYFLNNFKKYLKNG